MRSKRKTKDRIVSFTLMFVMVLSLFTGFSSADVRAEGTLPGARSGSSDSGDVFLGGNYIEVGVSKGGSFGTYEAPSDGFHPMCAGKGLGLVSDGDGFDVGEESITGDFFLPGTPEERSIVGYKINDEEISNRQADRNNISWVTPIQELSTVDESDVSAGVLKAVTTGITKDNVKYVQTVSFNVNDKFFKTDVEITNLNEDVTVNDLRFVRSFDPDQDADKHSVYDTYNKVICNPNSSTPYTEEQCAMVVARGGVTYAGFFFMAFDERARASAAYFAPNSAYAGNLWKDDTSLSTVPDTSLVDFSEDNTNDYVYEDNGIAITFACGNLAPGESTTLTYYSSLDPNVEESIQNVIAAAAGEPVVSDKTTTIITINAVPGEEYSIDGGVTWQDSGVFEGLTPGTVYQIIARKKAVDGEEPGEPSDPIEVITRVDSVKSAVVPSIKSKTDTSIAVMVVEGQEYSIDGGTTWSKTGVFKNLNPDTEYSIIARLAATDTEMPSGVSAPTVLKTLPKVKSELDDIGNVEVDVIVANNVHSSVAVRPSDIYNAVKERDVELDYVGTCNLATLIKDYELDVKLSLTIEGVSDKLADTDKEAIEKAADGMKIGDCYDISLKVLADNYYSGTIEQGDSEILFELGVPVNVLKAGKNFKVARLYYSEESSTPEITILEDIDTNTDTVSFKTDKTGVFVFLYEEDYAPDKPVEAAKTATSITIKTVEGEEYSIDGGKTWQTSGLFENLTPGQTYDIIARKQVAEGETPGKISEKLTVTTPQEVIIEQGDVFGVITGDADSSYTLSLGNGNTEVKRLENISGGEEFVFKNVPDGVYNLVLTKTTADGKTFVATKMVTVENGKPVDLGALDIGDKQTEVEVEQEAPQVVAGGLEQLYIAVPKEVTDAGVDVPQIIADGGTAKVILAVVKAKTTDVLDSMKKEAESKQKEVGVVFDAEVDMKITTVSGEEQVIKISDTESLIHMVMPLSEKDQGKTGYQVLRSHLEKGQTEETISVLPELTGSEKTSPTKEGFFIENGYVHIWAHKFSTYAVLYDEVVTVPVDDDDSSDDGSQTTAIVSAETGDATPLGGLFMMLILSGAGLGAFAVKGRKKEDTEE